MVSWYDLYMAANTYEVELTKEQRNLLHWLAARAGKSEQQLITEALEHYAPLVAKNADGDVTSVEIRKYLISKSGLIQMLTADLPVEKFDEELDKVVTPDGGLPPDFSRADIYFDHD
jgi:hypothetical protein